MLYLNCHVFKLGPDRAVRPVEPGTGDMSGPSLFKNSGDKDSVKTGQNPGLTGNLEQPGKPGSF